MKGKQVASSSVVGNDNKLIVVIFEINLTEDDMAWWIDSRATWHVYKTTKTTDEHIVLYMGSATTIPIKGIENIELKFTYGKIVPLTNVYYVPKVRKNLV